jgi:hypothetical protein
MQQPLMCVAVGGSELLTCMNQGLAKLKIYSLLLIKNKKHAVSSVFLEQ